MQFGSNLETFQNISDGSLNVKPDIQNHFRQQTCQDVKHW